MDCMYPKIIITTILIIVKKYHSLPVILKSKYVFAIVFDIENVDLLFELR